MSERRLAAIMFTDIVGYTSLMGSDEDKAFDILKRNHAIHEKLIEKHNGTLIKEIGDGTLASFPLASYAVRCAMEIQQEAKSQNIPLKIGIHEGEMVMVGVDVLGDGVNVASRLQEISQEGCITISGKVYSDIKNKAGIIAKLIGEKKLKNVDDPVKVYEILCEEQESAQSSEHQPRKSNKLLYYVLAGLVMIITAILIWQFLPDKGEDSQSIEVRERMDKSIAVLPFRNDSPDQENEYFCNGMIEEILTNLQKIKDIRVKSRTSSEQYRNPDKDLMIIAKELDVAFILEGSVRKAGNDLRITAQLINGKTGDHLWADTYDGKYTEEIFKFQSDIAIKIAEALNAIITPEEKQKISKVPTMNVTAYDFILQAREELWKYWAGGDIMAMKKAESMINKVLELDPGYALGWTRKGGIYWDRYGSTQEYFENDYLDSVLWYCNKAITLNPDEGLAYSLNGMVYHKRGNMESAIDYYEKALEVATEQRDDITFWETSWRLGYLYLYQKNYIKGISLIREAVRLAKGSPQDYRHLLHRLAYAYSYIGAFEEAENYYVQSKNLGANCLRLCFFYTYQGNFQTSVDCASTCCQTGASQNQCNYIQANAYLQLRDFETSLQYFREFRNSQEQLGRIQQDNLYREGFALIQLGYQEEGTKLIEEQLDLLDKSKKLGRSDGYDYHYAAIYASRGDYKRALLHLRNYEETVIYPNSVISIIPIHYIQYDIMFENFRDQEEFKNFVKEIQDKNAAIREEIREMEEREEIDL